MTFSIEWDEKYKSDAVNPTGVDELFQMLDWFVPGQQDKVLELGCGLGGNVIYWLKRPSDYYGIDGSETAIRKTKAAYPYIADHIACGDFTKALPFDIQFDAVFDRASISHNSHEAIVSCLDVVWSALKPGGLFVGVDWFSTMHSEFMRGDRVDMFTRTNYQDGQFVGVGNVHFSNVTTFDLLFHKYQGVFLRERIVRRPIPTGRFMNGGTRFRWQSPEFDYMEYVSAVWDVVARKPA